RKFWREVESLALRGDEPSQLVDESAAIPFPDLITPPLHGSATRLAARGSLPFTHSQTRAARILPPWNQRSEVQGRSVESHVHPSQRGHSRPEFSFPSPILRGDRIR